MIMVSISATGVIHVTWKRKLTSVTSRPDLGTTRPCYLWAMVQSKGIHVRAVFRRSDMELAESTYYDELVLVQTCCVLVPWYWHRE